MPHLFKLLTVSMIALGISGCNIEKLNTQIQQTIPQVCSSAAGVHNAFLIVASTGELKQSLVTKVEAYWLGIQTLCDKPTEVKAETLLIKVAEFYAVIKLAKQS